MQYGSTAVPLAERLSDGAEAQDDVQVCAHALQEEGVALLQRVAGA